MMFGLTSRGLDNEKHAWLVMLSTQMLVEWFVNKTDISFGCGASMLRCGHRCATYGKVKIPYCVAAQQSYITASITLWNGRICTCGLTVYIMAKPWLWPHYHVSTCGVFKNSDKYHDWKTRPMTISVLFQLHTTDRLQIQANSDWTEKIYGTNHLVGVVGNQFGRSDRGET